jgi:hypothetical protein
LAICRFDRRILRLQQRDLFESRLLGCGRDPQQQVIKQQAVNALYIIPEFLDPFD